MFKTNLLQRFHPKPLGRGHNSVWMSVAPWRTYLEEHVRIFCTGPQSANRSSVGVSLDRWRLFHNTCRGKNNLYMRLLSNYSEHIYYFLKQELGSWPMDLYGLQRLTYLFTYLLTYIASKKNSQSLNNTIVDTCFCKQTIHI